MKYVEESFDHAEFTACSDNLKSALKMPNSWIGLYGTPGYSPSVTLMKKPITALAEVFKAACFSIRTCWSKAWPHITGLARKRWRWAANMKAGMRR